VAASAGACGTEDQSSGCTLPGGAAAGGDAAAGPNSKRQEAAKADSEDKTLSLRRLRGTARSYVNQALHGITICKYYIFPLENPPVPQQYPPAESQLTGLIGKNVSAVKLLSAGLIAAPQQAAPECR
jgi:hypothetical protein